MEAHLDVMPVIEAEPTSEQVAAEIVALESQIGQLEVEQAQVAQQIAAGWADNQSKALANDFNRFTPLLAGAKARLKLLLERQRAAERREALERYEAACKIISQMHTEIVDIDGQIADLDKQRAALGKHRYEVSSGLQIPQGRRSKAATRAHELGVSNAELDVIWKRYEIRGYIG